ncbi:MAG: phospholipase D-like domain-containing protein [Pseudotabrizicola sp.]|uniref:phospholipase D-like domain-containing protein n=1 Tax=Pseudotabrizicola sp. TaxID=2939647 RepID=UPI00272646A2|nr:phospholipase D-like domain-containing protein [Pseudotabrizicola sp.]MDO9639931.1 phospholipase D-like domain-containing protein [Pseudotabrizicola sp.]
MSRMRRAGLIGAVMVVSVGIAIVVLNLLPDQRELRAPVKAELGASDPDFRRSMSGLYGSNLLGGNRIDTLVNGDQIFPAMLDAIRGAEVSINFETYIYWSGRVARDFAAALAERAQAGVEVRVLLDWVGSAPMEADLITRMEAAGVRVVRFRPPHWYTLDRINNRTHRKFLIVDGQTGFTGGVGIGDEWLGNARNPDEWRETHYRVSGPVVAMMQGAFVSNWVEDTGEVLQAPAFFPPIEPAGDAVAQLVISSTGSRNYIHLMLMTALAAAEQRIRIATPYFVPDDVAIAQLLAARARGVEIDILVPGPLNDNQAVRHASRAFWGPLLESGIRIHEYQPTFSHAKLLVVDEVFTSVGSTNFDERSFRLNDEANLNVYDTDFARRESAVFDADLTDARPVSLAEWQNRPLRKRIVDWGWSWLRTQF